MLFPSQAKIMAPVNNQVGRLGEAPDVHPGIILDLVPMVRELRDGREVETTGAIVAMQVTAQAKNGGHKYLTLARNGQPIPIEFLWPRAIATGDGESLLIPGLDDFATREDVQAQLQQDLADYVEHRGLSAQAEAKAKTSAKDALAV